MMSPASRLIRRCLPALMLLCFAPGAQAIVNGSPVDQTAFKKRFPWAVAIENPRSKNICTGALISPTFVLTAAHCTGPDRYVRVGGTLRAEARRVKVSRALRHPRYSPERLLFDVGLLQLAEPMDISPLPVISLGEYYLLVVEDAEVTIVGWGRTPGGEGFSDQLRTAELALGDLVESGTVLTFTADTGPCGGDSGGPIILMDLEKKPALIGVASATDGNLCREKGGVSAYTRVPVFLKFVKENVPDLP